jgi:CBS domain-containing protein
MQKHIHDIPEPVRTARPAIETAIARHPEACVFDVMRQPVEIIEPTQSVRGAASRMAERGVGFLAVCEEGKAVGVLTDRDITVRVVATGIDPATTPIREVMTKRVFGCPPNAALWEAHRLMRDSGVRRLVITDSTTYKVIGVIAMDDLSSMASQMASAGPEGPLGRRRHDDVP